MSIRFQAIIRPQRAEQVFLELAHSELVEALQAEECQGSGTRHVGSTEGGLLPKVSVCGVVDEAQLDRVLEIIRSLACAGRSGDGKIFLSQVLQEA